MKIMIIGAGNSGLAMAGHLAQQGCDIYIWSRGLKTLRAKGYLELRGTICGHYRVNTLEGSFQKCIENFDLIIVTTPATAHEEIAQNLSMCQLHLPPILLSPGRVLGAAAFEKQLNKPEVVVAEAQTVLHTARSYSDHVYIYAIKKKVLVSSITPEKTTAFFQALPQFFHTYYQPCTSYISLTLSSVGMMLHCAPMLLNIGWIESANEFMFYKDAFTPTIVDLIQKLDEERMKISEKANAPILSLSTWLRESYQAEGENLYDLIHSIKAYRLIPAPNTLQHRYIFEDIAHGLAPLEMIGKKLSVKTPITTHLIDLANLVLKCNFRNKVFPLGIFLNNTHEI